MQHVITALFRGKGSNAAVSQRTCVSLDRMTPGKPAHQWDPTEAARLGSIPLLSVLHELKKAFWWSDLLRIAVREGHVEVYFWLRGMTTNIAVKAGLITTVIYFDRWEILDSLLAEGVKCVYEHTSAAARRQKWDIVKKLLEYGAPCSKPTADYTLDNGPIEMLDVLAQTGHRNHFGYENVYYAAHRHDWELVQKLIGEYGVPCKKDTTAYILTHGPPTIQYFVMRQYASGIVEQPSHAVLQLMRMNVEENS